MYLSELKLCSHKNVSLFSNVRVAHFFFQKAPTKNKDKRNILLNFLVGHCLQVIIKDWPPRGQTMVALLERDL